MNKELLAGIVVSSLIFAFPRKFPVRLYTKLKKFFKGKSKSTDLPETFDPNSTPEEAQLEAMFRSACKAVQNASSLDDTQQLALYGLYKQALFGDCDKPRPRETDFVDLAKWGAWNSQRGRTKAGAKEEYIRTVERFVPGVDIKAGDYSNAKTGDDDEDLFMTDEEYRLMKQRDDKKPTMGMKFSKPAMGTEDMWNASQSTKEDADIGKFFKLIDDEDLDAIEKSIRNGFDLYKESSAGMKAIHYAIENEKENVVALLCEHYTDLNTPDKTGMTPLHYAVAHEDEGIIEILLSKNVDLYKEDNEGESAMDLASARVKKIINAYNREEEGISSE